MKRLPTEAALVASIDFSTDYLARIRLYAGELLRRRAFDAGGDGYPTSSGGGGTSGGTPSSSTEVAALTPPMLDPVGRYIDEILDAVAEADRRLQRASSCLAAVLAVDQEQRGRISTVVECECCDNPISGIGEDRRRNGFCDACYRAWLRWRVEAEDPTARSVSIAQRRQKLSETACLWADLWTSVRRRTVDPLKV